MKNRYRSGKTEKHIAEFRQRFPNGPETTPAARTSNRHPTSRPPSFPQLPYPHSLPHLFYPNSSLQIHGYMRGSTLLLLQVMLPPSQAAMSLTQESHLILSISLYPFTSPPLNASLLICETHYLKKKKKKI